MKLNSRQGYVVGAACVLAVLLLWHPPMQVGYYQGEMDKPRLIAMLVMVAVGAFLTASALRDPTR